MISFIDIAIRTAVAGADLTETQMHAAVGAIMDGDAGEAQTAALLTALRMKGESIQEIVGAARAMMERCATIPCSTSGLLDTCGTGGDGLHTFNISTATALVVAAAGVPVAKHGNRGVSSSSGSADVLRALGVNIELSPEQVGRCIDEIGIGFCFAPLVHGAMKHAAPVRRQLGFRTIFNLLGPLTNPADAEFQLIGANTTAAAEKLAGAVQQLGRTRVVVVCGNGELDEVSLWGETAAWIVADGELREDRWTSASFGLPECRVEDLTVTSPSASADVIRGVLSGTPGPARDIVTANAAAALFAAGKSTDLKQGVATVRHVLANGTAAEFLARFAEFTQAADL
jgi:anthranilate phosphoribosyltransferase